jgi:hypothetical protein
MDLAASGFHVDLFDRNSDCMTQASLRNEGKVHLGYVYANDPTLRSAAMMVEGAACFGRLLEQWLEVPMSRFGHSRPFNYVVHRDSLITSAEFDRHVKRTHELVVQRVRPEDYFGEDLSQAPARVPDSEVADDYHPSAVQAVYRTNEIGIDPRALAQEVRLRIAVDSSIHPILETEVRRVRIDGDGLAVDFTNRAGSDSVRYDHVVNALWDGRLAIDATMGLLPKRPWLFRVKHFLALRSASLRLPSTTIVLGPFGDVVDYGNETFYLSWYPSGLQGSSSGLEVPDHLRTLPDGSAGAVRAGIAEGLASVVNGVRGLSPADLDAGELAGGVIFAWGASDIDDLRSGLHDRFAIGPFMLGRYHTVDTGKLTTAPLHAKVVGDRIRASR